MRLAQRLLDRRYAKLDRVRLLAFGLAIATGCGRVGFAPVGNGDGGADRGDGAQTDGTQNDAALVSPCGTTTVLQDDFTSATTGSQWSKLTATGITITQGGGQLSFALAASVAANTGSQYTQTTPVDLRGGCLTGRLDMAPNPAVNVYSYLLLVVGTAGVGFELNAGRLDALFYTSTSAVTEVTPLPWDPVAQKYVRLSESAGTYTWSTSPDGATFTTYGTSTAAGISASSVKVQVGVATGPATANNGGTATFGPVSAATP